MTEEFRKELNEEELDDIAGGIALKHRAKECELCGMVDSNCSKNVNLASLEAPQMAQSSISFEYPEEKKGLLN